MGSAPTTSKNGSDVNGVLNLQGGTQNENQYFGKEIQKMKKKSDEAHLQLNRALASLKKNQLLSTAEFRKLRHSEVSVKKPNPFFQKYAKNKNSRLDLQQNQSNKEKHQIAYKPYQKSRYQRNSAFQIHSKRMNSQQSQKIKKQHSSRSFILNTDNKTLEDNNQEEYFTAPNTATRIELKVRDHLNGVKQKRPQPVMKKQRGRVQAQSHNHSQNKISSNEKSNNNSNNRNLKRHSKNVKSERFLNFNHLNFEDRGSFAQIQNENKALKNDDKLFLVTEID